MSALTQLTSLLYNNGIESNINHGQLSDIEEGKHYALLLKRKEGCSISGDTAFELVLRWLDPDSTDPLEGCPLYGDDGFDGEGDDIEDQFTNLSPKQKKIFDIIVENFNKKFPEYAEKLINEYLDKQKEEHEKNIKDLVSRIDALEKAVEGTKKNKKTSK